MTIQPPDPGLVDFPAEDRTCNLTSFFPEFVAKSTAMRSILSSMTDLATSDIPILIEGESGTGKELIAAAIHRLSNRRDCPFVSQNCGAVPESLVESEFFGHEKGAFTGATRPKPGLLEKAHTGTLFLDEIGEMDLNQQKKLLRILQERKVRRVGGNKDRPADFRVVSATNQVLEDLLVQGRFREDLFYRLSGASISLPPLRERRGDVALLVGHFNRQFSQEVKRPPLLFQDETMKILSTYGWPGNVRELRHEIWRLVTSVRRAVMPDDVSRRILRSFRESSSLPLDTNSRSLKEVENDIIGGMIRGALTKTTGNLAQAARILGVSRSTLYRRMKQYKIKLEKAR